LTKKTKACQQANKTLPGKNKRRMPWRVQVYFKYITIFPLFLSKGNFIYVGIGAGEG